ncbi:MAG: hypothetical protein WC696_00585 [Candidatus Methylopumilus sp.]|jgi:hypothetical protein
MRLLQALLISAAIHIAAVFLISDFVWIKQPEQFPNKKWAFYVSLKSAEKQSVSAESFPALINRSRTPQLDLDNLRRNNSKDNTSAARKSVSTEQELHDAFDGYYSTTDVEIKALPVSNLDISMFNGQFVSGLSVKMRLYINAFGSVVKIERLESLEQDRPMAERLEELLYSLTFLPARKDGLPVDSYQDVELSF